MLFIAASNNEGKLQEMRRILSAMGHTVKSQKEVGISAEPEENGATFEENALIKARAICALCKCATIADDSGLCADALCGEPGVYSARYCGQHGDDEKNNDTLLYNMRNIEQSKRTARFVSVIAAVLPSGEYITARGECEGSIGYERHGNNGFGYDPIFIPQGYDGKSYAQLSCEQKDKISHRGKALAKLAELLPQFIK